MGARDGENAKWRQKRLVISYAFVSLDPEYWNGIRDARETSRLPRGSPPQPRGRDTLDRDIAVSVLLAQRH